MPKVTVLMSVYNGQRYLRRALKSILSQSFRDFEFLIINDGSSDDSRNIICSYEDKRIRLVDNPENIGLTRSLNRGLELAQGPLIARQDADDISYPDRLEKQVACMDSSPEVALLGSQQRNIDEHGQPSRYSAFRKPCTDPGIRWNFMFGSTFVHPSVMYRRKVVWEELGGYDTEFMTGQDAELWARIAAQHRVLNLPDVLVDYRFHSKSLSGCIHAPIRQGHSERMENLLHALMVRYLEWPDVPPDWARLWVELNTPVPFIGAKRTLHFLDVIEAMHARFVEINPQARSSREIGRHRAELQAHLAFYLVAHSRWASLKAFARVLRTDLRMVFSCGPRYFALLFLGHRAKRLYRLWQKK